MVEQAFKLSPPNQTQIREEARMVYWVYLYKELQSNTRHSAFTPWEKREMYFKMRLLDYQFVYSLGRVHDIYRRRLYADILNQVVKDSVSPV